MSGNNHKRLDALMSWAPLLQVGDTCEEEFEALRKIPRQSTAQRRRAVHLEKHLDAGEIVCDCYENVRRDIIE